MIGLLLVICIPATPKAFSQSKMPKKMLGTFKSWVSILTHSSTRSSTTTGREKDSLQLEAGLPSAMAPSGFTKNISGDRSKMITVPSASVSELDAPVHGDGILRVQEFSRGEEPGHQSSQADVRQLQHPWDAIR